MKTMLALAMLVQSPGDGYPGGLSTAEGAACDLARAFKTLDAKLFRSTCVEPLGEDKGSQEYRRFLDHVAKKMEEDRTKGAKPGNIPKAITKVYKARHLSKNGPASTAYALFDMLDVQFVDVVCEQNDGKSFTCRTLVFQLKDKSWRVLPRPDLYPLLSFGLNDESDSTEELPRK